jgi:polyisoprenoid-binding protein YceI
MVTANGGNLQDLWTLFDARAFPEITFQALADAPFKDGKADIKGTLSVHGVSKPFTFEATMNQTGNSPHGGGMWHKEGPAVGLSLRGSFKRADFGMGDEPEMPGRFGDSVTLMLEMQAIRQ